MSGVVYFAFMTAWSWFFELAGLSRAITVGLGIAVTLVNLNHPERARGQGAQGRQ